MSENELDRLQLDYPALVKRVLALEARVRELEAQLRPIPSLGVLLPDEKIQWPETRRGNGND